MDLYKNSIDIFRKDERGIAAIELIIVLPLLLIMFYGSVEISRYVLADQKLQKTANELGQVVTQSTNNSSAPLNGSMMAQMFDATQYMMWPYGTANNMRVIVTDIVNTGTTSTPVQTVEWQWCSPSVSFPSGNPLSRLTAITPACTYKFSNAYNTNVPMDPSGTSANPVGCMLQNANFSNAGFAVNGNGAFEGLSSPGDEVVVVEVFYQYTPITNQNLVPTSPLYMMSANYPRQGTNNFVWDESQGSPHSSCP